MRDVLRTFQERKEEIELYFQHLNHLMVDKAKILNKDGSTYNISLDLAQILRANAFLLLYNVMEYSIVQGVEAIYTDIITKGISYDEVRENIQKEIINSIKKEYSTDKFVNQVTNIALEIIRYYPQKLFSGNVDGESIKDVALKYGFSHKIKGRVGKNIGKRLDNIKKRRNDLAHGSISFKECGKEIPIEDLNKIKDEILTFINGILNNIDTFIQRQEYKR